MLIMRLLRHVVPRNDRRVLSLTIVNDFTKMIYRMSLRALRSVILSPSLCHSERSKESPFVAQGKLREESPFTAQDKLREESRCSAQGRLREAIS